ncbi:MarR family winged helix-turn-helix transcriptional regulator [Pseudolysinimonas sp.]|jgi:DNA-binding MarR family transcriptional regulator|uniref:MarR family winged helix-turn-helix transcriptional regulator n=1 Tax=Pseudolysinimonas sp. TaxID=2680009 RepID=UPI0037838CAF
MSTVSEIPPADWELWRTMRVMNEQLGRELDRQLQRDAGISQADYGILVTLFETPERQMRTGELGEVLAWEKSRVSHQVARMEARGLVERVVCESDGRGTWVTLATAGKRALLGAMRQHAAAIRESFLDELEDDEKQIMLRATSRVLARLNAVCETAAAEENVPEPGAA